MAKKKDHFLFEENKDGHKPVGNSTEGGACLTGHDKATHKKFRRKHSCNFRYQALEQAKSHGKIKRYLHSYHHAIPTLNSDPMYAEGIKTSAYRGGSSNKIAPWWYCEYLKVPKKGDWDVGGPQNDFSRINFRNSKDVVKKTENFTRGKWPYWNNAHHLIPKGQVKLAITNEGAVVGPLIEAALLKAKYNINHKRNMLMMPQDKEVAFILNMPRHIQNKDGDAPELKAECTSHPVYDQMARTMKKGLKRIILRYREIALKAEEGQCTIPEVKLDKKQLENLSDKLLKTILAGAGGVSLDKLASLKNNR